MGREAKRKSTASVEPRRSTRLQTKTSSSFNPRQVYYSSAVSSPASCPTIPSQREVVQALHTPPVLFRWNKGASYAAQHMVSVNDKASGKCLVDEVQRQLLTYARRSEGKEIPGLVSSPVANSFQTESQEEKYNPGALVTMPVEEFGVGSVSMPVEECGVGSVAMPGEECEVGSVTITVEECGLGSTAQESKREAVWASNTDIMPEEGACNGKAYGNPPMQSMALSEKICMWADDDGVDEASSGQLVEIRDYKVKETCIPILTKIFEKHGDIASNCFLVTAKARSALLTELCSVVANFQGKSFCEIPLMEIEEALALINDFKKAGLVVDWFRESLEKALYIKRLVKLYPDLMNQRANTAEAIKDKQRELEVYRAKKAALEEKQRSVEYELELVNAEASRISEIMSDAKAQVSKYTSKPLMDVL